MIRTSIKYSFVVVAYFVTKLAEDTFFGWVNEKIAMEFSISSPSVADALQGLWTYGLPALTVFLLFSAYHWWHTRYGAEEISPQITETPAKSVVDPDNDLIPLTEAATRAYEQLEGSNADLLVFIETCGKGSNELTRTEREIKNIKYFIITGNKIAVFGKHPPSRKERQIPFDEIDRCIFDHIDNSLKDPNPNKNELQYIELSVNWHDVERIIKEECKKKFVPDTLEKMPFTDFIKQARHLGLDFNNANAVDDFFEELRQSASDNELRIFGRKDEGIKPVLTWIPRDYWESYVIDLDVMLHEEADGKITEITNNNKLSHTQYYLDDNKTQTIYFDLHLERRKAMKVLEKCMYR